MKNGAPPDEFGVLQCLSPIEFHGLTSVIDFLWLSFFGFWYLLSQFFREGMGSFNTKPNILHVFILKLPFKAKMKQSHQLYCNKNCGI